MANGRNISSNPASDPRGGHLRLYWDTIDSNAWRCLSATDQRAYIALRRQLRSTNNGDLSMPLSVVRQHGIASSATLAKSLRALVAVGLVAVTRSGGCKRDGQRLVTLYRFTDREAFENPMKHLAAYLATNEWKAVQTLGQGRELMRQAEARAAGIEASKKKSPLQSLIVTASINEVVKPLTASIREVWAPPTASNIEAGGKAKKSCKANNGGGFKKSANFSDSSSPTSINEVLSTTAMHRGEYGPADGLGIYRRLTARPAKLFTSLLH